VNFLVHNSTYRYDYEHFTSINAFVVPNMARMSAIMIEIILQVSCENLSH